MGRTLLHKGNDDKKGAAGKDGSGKSHWEKVTKAEIKNLKLVDSGKKKHPCAGDLSYTKHDWAPGTGAVGRFNERGTKYRPCAWELNDGICACVARGTGALALVISESQHSSFLRA